MKGNRSSVSKASSYKDMGAYWDTHELDEVWDKTRKVKFDVQIESEAIYYAIEKGLSGQVESLAKRQGVSSDTLINLWIQEKIQEQISQ
jgi:hypothetical protein